MSTKLIPHDGVVTDTDAEASLKEACRTMAPEALAVIIEVMHYGKKDSDRLSAAQMILDRGFGRPSQHIEGKVDSGVVVEVVNFQLENDPRCAGLA